MKLEKEGFNLNSETMSDKKCMRIKISAMINNISHFSNINKDFVEFMFVDFFGIDNMTDFDFLVLDNEERNDYYEVANKIYQSFNYSFRLQKRFYCFLKEFLDRNED